MDTGLNLIVGIIGSIIATAIVALFIRWYKIKRELRVLHEEQLKIGKTFLDQGLTKFHFSRDDYGRTLASFLGTAKHSISIVSISLKVTDDEGQLAGLFKRQLSANPDFEISISLINPHNQALVKVAADTLNITKEKLSQEIVEMLKELLSTFDSLNPSEKSRIKILVHDCFPMGSVVMIDATQKGGMIQVETKLYKAARTDSFGFQLTKESPFFKHNYVAWNRIIHESKPISKEQLYRKRNTTNKTSIT